MSFSAYVICSCYQEGKTVDPPHKKYVRFDDDGLNLVITDIYLGKGNNPYQMEAEFEEWKRTACEHEDMELAHEYLSNNSGMADFRETILNLGGDTQYPILAKYLPEANGGILPSEFAQQALDELLLFENEKSVEEIVLLTEKSTGEVITSVNTDTFSLFVFTEFSKNYYGIDRNGFFILENIKEEEDEISYLMFHSKNLIQQTISKNVYKFIDIPTGDSFECNAKLYPIRSEATEEYEFEVKSEWVNIAKQYQYIVDPLKRLAQASLRSGNPIHWI